MCEDLLEIVNKQVSATSLGVVILFPKGILFTIDFNFSSPFLSVLIHLSYAGVQLSEIIMALTLIESLIKSTAHSRVKPSIPPFEAAYPEVPPCPVSATLDPIFKIFPFVFLMYGKQYFVIAK